LKFHTEKMRREWDWKLVQVVNISLIWTTWKRHLWNDFLNSHEVFIFVLKETKLVMRRRKGYLDHYNGATTLYTCEYSNSNDTVCLWFSSSDLHHETIGVTCNKSCVCYDEYQIIQVYRMLDNKNIDQPYT